ncbi:hypothetical protein V9T40_005417 [Parthenolecanium corni]|uniref:Uncharacterized protein n=1 Tax=Parthenolecanium corni TaxID=536013 RepID=A0AAN9Y4R2_9HEMI
MSKKQEWSVYEDSDTESDDAVELAVQSYLFAHPSGTSSPQPCGSNDTTFFEDSIQKIIDEMTKVFNPHTPAYDEECRLYRNMECIEPSRRHELRGKKVWWELGDGYYDLSVNSTLYEEDIISDEIDILMGVLIDDFVEEEETVEDKLERLFECETTRVSRRRRPYNTVSYIRQPDGRWYEIGVNGEIVPCDEELSQSLEPTSTLFTPSREDIDVENHGPQAPRCNRGERRAFQPLYDSTSTPGLSSTQSVQHRLPVFEPFSSLLEVDSVSAIRGSSADTTQADSAQVDTTPADLTSSHQQYATFNSSHQGFNELELGSGPDYFHEMNMYSDYAESGVEYTPVHTDSDDDFFFDASGNTFEFLRSMNDSGYETDTDYPIQY